MVITAVVALAVVLVVMIEDPLGRAIMLAVAAIAVVRAFLLTRSLRRQ